MACLLGADVNMASDTNWTPFQEICRREKKTLMRLILNYGDLEFCVLMCPVPYMLSKQLRGDAFVLKGNNLFVTSCVCICREQFFMSMIICGKENKMDMKNLVQNTNS